MIRQRNRAVARTSPLSIPHRAMAVLMGLAIAAVIAHAALADEGEGEVIRSHGYSYYGDLSYPADYEHFNYVNPDAPKGGEISLYALSGTF